MQTCDVLIIGGGLAGNTLACALADLPLRIILVDNQPANKPSENHTKLDTRSLALAHRSAEYLKNFGLWEDAELAKNITSINTIQVTDRGLFGNTRFSAKEQGLTALGYIVPLPCLQNALQHKLSQMKQVEIIQPATLHTIISTTAEETIVEITQQNEKKQIQTKLLIAADGAHSFVRQWHNIHIEKYDYGQSAIVGTIAVEAPEYNTAYESFTSSGPIAFLPVGENRYGFVWCLKTNDAQRYQNLDDEVFLTPLQKAFGYRLGRFLALGKRVIFPVSMQIAKEQIKPGTLLLGNAARTLHPIAGQGYNLILRDIMGLKRTLSDALEQQLTLGNLTTLQRYLDLRKADQHRIIRFTDRLIRLFSNRHPLLTLGRNLGLLVFAGLPKLKRTWLSKMLRG